MTAGTSNASEKRMSEHWESLVRAVVAAFPRAVVENASAMRCVLHVGAVCVGVRVRRTYAYDKPVVVIAADVARAGVIEASLALSTNALLASGALALDGDMLVLRALVPEATAAPFVLASLELVAREAATLKPEIHTRATALAGLACFAD